MRAFSESLMACARLLFSSFILSHCCIISEPKGSHWKRATKDANTLVLISSIRVAALSIHDARFLYISSRFSGGKLEKSCIMITVMKKNTYAYTVAERK